MIDYALAKKQGPKLKAALTRAKKASDPESRWVATKNACIQAVTAWKHWGAWPDGWVLWQCALDDAFNHLQRNPYGALNPIPTHCPRLEEL